MLQSKLNKWTKSHEAKRKIRQRQEPEGSKGMKWKALDLKGMTDTFKIRQEIQDMT